MYTHSQIHMNAYAYTIVRVHTLAYVTSDSYKARIGGSPLEF